MHEEEEEVGARFKISDGGDDDELMEPLEDIPDFGALDEEDPDKDR